MKEYDVGRACSTCDGEQRYIEAFCGKPERRTPLRSSVRKWEENVKCMLNK